MKKKKTKNDIYDIKVTSYLSISQSNKGRERKRRKGRLFLF